LGFVFYQVVEIVDQYETVCIPAANITDKVKYIQTGSPQDLICHRTITVSFLWNKFSFMLLLFVKEINTLGSFVVIL
jgi:hypothetical protein